LLIFRVAIVIGDSHLTVFLYSDLVFDLVFALRKWQGAAWSGAHGA
jgi:hypothetical protein